MTIPTVGHWKRDQCTLYIGRPSMWGNPFSHRPSKFKGTIILPQTEDCIARFEEHARANLWGMLGELSGHVLGCWCKPAPCHGDVLVKLFRERFKL